LKAAVAASVQSKVKSVALNESTSASPFIVGAVVVAFKILTDFVVDEDVPVSVVVAASLLMQLT